MNGYNVNSKFERLLDLCKRARLVNVRGFKKIRESLPWYRPAEIGVEVRGNLVEAYIKVDGEVVRRYALTAENAVNIVKPAGRDIHVATVDYDSNGMLTVQNLLTFRW